MAKLTVIIKQSFQEIQVTQSSESHWDDIKTKISRENHAKASAYIARLICFGFRREIRKMFSLFQTNYQVYEMRLQTDFLFPRKAAEVIKWHKHCKENNNEKETQNY